jgi:hypothetical protein
VTRMVDEYVSLYRRVVADHRQRSTARR